MAARRAKLNRLLGKRTSIQIQARDFENLINENIHDLTIESLEVRVPLLERLFEQFCGVQDEIEALDQTEVTRNIRRLYIEAYCDIKARLQGRINEIRAANNTANQSQSAPSRNVNVKLPRLDLVKFSGKYTEWLEFSSTFDSVIDKNPALSNVEKFQYLRSSLTGEAARCIQSFDITEQSYEEAKKVLRQRYNNTRLIVDSHISQIFDAAKTTTDAASQLRKLSDSVTNHLRSLQTMSSKEQLCDSLLIFLVSSKLDPDSLLKWEEHMSRVSNRVLPTWDQFSAFLGQRCQALEQLQNQNALHKSVKKQTRNTSLLVSAPSSQNSCSFCKDADHSIHFCSKFLLLNPSNRLVETKRLRLCINCLKPDHVMQSCKSSTCRTCKQRHHTLLHFPPKRDNVESSTAHANPGTSTNTVDKNNKPVPSTSRAESLVASPCRNPSCQLNPVVSQVLLGTAVVLVADKNGKFIKCRALLDTGSTPNFITESLAQKLNLPEVDDPIYVSGIGAVNSLKSRRGLMITIKAHFDSFRTNAYVSIVPKITGNIPMRPVDLSRMVMPKGIVLADPGFYEPDTIDLLLGADHFVDLLCEGKIEMGPTLPKLLNTSLGWIVMGKICVANNPPSIPQICHIATEDTTETLLKKLWEIEDMNPLSTNLSPDEQLCENLFTETTNRDNQGRYVVKLPFLKPPTLLGSSFSHAINRFHALERRFRKDPKLKAQYTNFMLEFSKLGHISLTKANQIPDLHYFMPHHAVLKPSSSTTSLRVVFDASAATDTGYSLNQLLAPGPKTQDGLFANLVRFRMHQYAFCADITKMYRQVVLDDTDSYFQLLLWRERETDELDIYRITRVIYGTTSAAFLATRVLRQLAYDYAEEFPLGSQHLLTDFYVDDMLSGDDDLEVAKQIKDEIIKLLKIGGFELRKWSSNSSDLLNDIPIECQEPLIEINDEGIIRALGLNWHPRSDSFKFFYVPMHSTIQHTKRSVVSDIARLFDPLGLIGPIISLARMFVQDLWSSNLDWDSHLPSHLSEKWSMFRNELHLIKELCFPRAVVIPTSSRSLVQLHAFCDASEQAYGACCYLLSRSVNHETKIQLLCSRSKVAPIRKMSIPRLELCGALLLSEMVSSVIKLIPFKLDGIYLWTDSSIVLHWLLSPSNTWQTFVANRVSKIHELTNDCTWRHVRSQNNPADLLSRGALPEQLLNSNLWFHGPDFLYGNVDEWPSLNFECPNESILERRNKKFSLAVTPLDNIVTDNKFANSFSRLRRVFGYIYRFINNARTNLANRVRGKLSAEERLKGETLIIKFIQMTSYPEEYHCLSSNKPISTSSSLKSLNPVIDVSGILRVGGRLLNAPISYDSKHPIILPKSHQFSRAVIRHFHLQNYHVGAQTLLAIIRQRYWIVNGKTTVNSEMSKCIFCFRRNPKLQQQLMGHLPRHRVQSNSTEIFVVTGIDCAGPFLATHGTRGRHTYKIYLVVFVCFYTRAIHLDIITNLSAKGFLNAFKRFIATRGKPKHVYSDNGLNFVGANSHLKSEKQILQQAFDEQIYPELSELGIEWHFNPPRSPHAGGLWESAVKSAKKLLFNALGQQSFTLEEFYTIAKETEAIMNSRPLFPLSNDPTDLSVLTPGHFIIGRPLLSLPESTTTQQSSLNDRYKQLKVVRTKIWNRYSVEYLQSLQRRNKWFFNSPNVTIGSLVLLKEENTPPLSWPRGRVVAIHPGNDGAVRVVTVRVGNSVFKRSVQSVALLPMKSVEAPTSTGAAC